MEVEEKGYKIFIDQSLQTYQTEIRSIFEALKKIPCEEFHFYFISEEKSDDLEKNILNIKNQILNEQGIDSVEINEKFKGLINHIYSSNVSFSWGYLEFEFVFIVISDPLLLDVPSALIGLVVHELIHGIERQRGLEDDLKRSLAVTINTFSDMADLIPQYQKSELILMLKSIGEFAIYALKDLYVNREAIERGFATEILDQYKFIFQIESIDGPSPHNFPKLELNLKNFNKKEILDLKEFEKAFLTLLGLMTAWLPFTRLSSYEKDQALEIKSFITENYNKVSLISERFRHLENVFLTEFTFSKSFHQKWFSEVFSIVIDILSCGEFIIWQFSHLVLKLENLILERKNKLDDDKLESDSEYYTLNDLILIPILKAAYLFSQESTLTSIRKEINQKLTKYLNEEEINEWKQFNHEYSIEHLLLFVLSELIQLLRKKFLLSIQNLRKYTGLVLDVLQLLIDIKKDSKNYDKYLEYKDQVLRFITERDSRFLSLKIIFPLEFEIIKELNDFAEIEDATPFTSDEASEFLMLIRFFALPKLNWILEIAKRFAKIIKLNIKHTSDPGNIDIEVIALTSVMLIKDFKDEEINHDLLIPIYRATLMALKIPVLHIKAIVQIFGNLLLVDIEEKIDEK